MIYNEEEGIIPVIESIHTCALPPGYERRIVAINDGSTDESQQMLERAARTYSVHTIQYKTRRGMPESFRGVFQYLAKVVQDDDIVFTLEADGTNDIACIPGFVEEIKKGADVVIASRYVPGAASIGLPKHRLLMSALINMFLRRILLRIPNVRDYTVLYRAYRGSVLRKYASDNIPFAARKSFAVIPEILGCVSHYTNKFAEVPLRYDYGLKKGPSKMKIFQTLSEYIRITPAMFILSLSRKK
ncbi:MAG: Glycosyl transferase [Candidatus Kaiserbacteria bacterium GW2011_GWB1_52_6]|uniref:Glycosyl transferase n=2 Tax=Candidatus Kaiseribacteriota TaxID=1752734 RepID=A0A0G2AGA2_9BACT|nr:MAG: Glycosyl transferase [Candidatus Kaiserbacteria bacterium GW2011_GWB1_52_6]KKW31559.1 MAG: Glycosyl transferase [Candidatus Kaiserbacteria bacterium GW2011_GWC2_52_8b]